MVVSAVALVWMYNNWYLEPVKEYRQKFKSTLLQKIVHELKPEMEYRPGGFMPKEDFQASQLFPDWDERGYSGEDYFEGKINGIPVRFSEIHAQKIIR